MLCWKVLKAQVGVGFQLLFMFTIDSRELIVVLRGIGEIWLENDGEKRDDGAGECWASSAILTVF